MICIKKCMMLLMISVVFTLVGCGKTDDGQVTQPVQPTTQEEAEQPVADTTEENQQASNQEESATETADKLDLGKYMEKTDPEIVAELKGEGELNQIEIDGKSTLVGRTYPLIILGKKAEVTFGYEQDIVNTINVWFLEGNKNDLTNALKSSLGEPSLEENKNNEAPDESEKGNENAEGSDYASLYVAEWILDDYTYEFMATEETSTYTIIIYKKNL